MCSISFFLLHFHISDGRFDSHHSHDILTKRVFFSFCFTLQVKIVRIMSKFRQYLVIITHRPVFFLFHMIMMIYRCFMTFTLYKFIWFYCLFSFVNCVVYNTLYHVMYTTIYSSCFFSLKSPTYDLIKCHVCVQKIQWNSFEKSQCVKSNKIYGWWIR